MCFMSSIANLCPIMNNFNALDFNECRSEEVMFHWRSVYLNKEFLECSVKRMGKVFSQHFSSLKILSDELEEYIKDSHSW